jgi:uncharacterized protein (DUF2164 family)
MNMKKLLNALLFGAAFIAAKYGVMYYMENKPLSDAEVHAAMVEDLNKTKAEVMAESPGLYNVMVDEKSYVYFFEQGMSEAYAVNGITERPGVGQEYSDEWYSEFSESFKADMMVGVCESDEVLDFMIKYNA